MASDMANSLMKQIADLRGDIDKVTSDDALRKKLLRETWKLLYDLETPGDSMRRIIYLPLQLVVVRTAVDLNLFERLDKVSEPLSVDTLAKQTNADPLLLGRLLRYLASVGIIKEASEDHYAANKVSHIFTEQGVRGGVINNFDNLEPCWSAMPQFLANTGYANPTDPANCPAQPGLQTDSTLFQWLPQHPQNFEAFNQWMAFQSDWKASCFDVFPVEEQLLKGAAAETPVFVDVGGGIGQQCNEFRQRYPNATGKVILQDLPHVVEQAKLQNGVEKMGHSFFTPQPIKGARAYYMRNIMHDFPDHKCVEILRNLRSAMTDESIIMIDDMVLPDAGQSYIQCQLDLTMMAALAGMERSRKQWEALLDNADLKIRDVHQYTEDKRDAIIVAVPK
ncbi:MAG: hypothetical protein M1816_003683 [Peltula sp. TS41687]|nr:MAG: hypothetical protein M1816_003683 [Peltula sp. TS41687]